MGDFFLKNICDFYYAFLAGKAVNLLAGLCKTKPANHLTGYGVILTKTAPCSSPRPFLITIYLAQKQLKVPDYY